MRVRFSSYLFFTGGDGDYLTVSVWRLGVEICDVCKCSRLCFDGLNDVCALLAESTHLGLWCVERGDVCRSRAFRDGYTCPEGSILESRK